MSEPSDNRQARRFPVNFPLVCRSKGQEQRGRALNVSRGGVLVATADLLIVGMLMEVVLSVPGADTFQFKGIVRHASQDSGTGIEFLEVMPHYQARFAAYLATLA